jgi:hypothetical protein
MMALANIESAKNKIVLNVRKPLSFAKHPVDGGFLVNLTPSFAHGAEDA